MYKEFYSGFDWLELPLVAMGVFMLAFLLVIARTFGWKKKADFDAVAALPLSDGTNPEVKP